MPLPMTSTSVESRWVTMPVEVDPPREPRPRRELQHPRVYLSTSSRRLHLRRHRHSVLHLERRLHHLHLDQNNKIPWRFSLHLSLR